jgi:hypothetical protein
MESVPFRQMRKIVEKIDAKIKATDPRLGRSARILHEEGTELFFESAFILKYGEWVIVITEHHGFHFYPEDDLIAYMQYERIHEAEDVTDEDL